MQISAEKRKNGFKFATCGTRDRRLNERNGERRNTLPDGKERIFSLHFVQQHVDCTGMI